MATVRGTIKWFDNRKGFGFILQDQGPDVFVHYSSIHGTGYKTLEEGDIVEYELGPSDKGPKAVQVTKIASAAMPGQNWATAAALGLKAEDPHMRVIPALSAPLASAPATAHTEAPSITAPAPVTKSVPPAIQS